MQVICTVLPIFGVIAKHTALKEPIVDEYVLNGLWLLLGALVGIFLESRTDIRSVVVPIMGRCLYGVFIGIAIYLILLFGSFIETYI